MSSAHPITTGVSRATGFRRGPPVVPGRCTRRAAPVPAGRSAYGGRVSESWDPADAGVLRLPSGRLVRGRALRRPLPAGPAPEFGVHLLGRPPAGQPWEVRWVRWPDFRLPSDPVRARETLVEAWRRCAGERVEIACGGGRGRTGTALACLAVLDGVPAAEAVDYVRRHYDVRAVETPWQRRYVLRFVR
jgi:hypothetical protein